MHGIIIVNTVYENNIICTMEISKNEKENLLKKEQKEIQILKNTVIKEKYIRVNVEEQKKKHKLENFQKTIAIKWK